MIKISRILAFPFIFLIKIYQIFISPILEVIAGIPLHVLNMELLHLKNMVF